MRENDADQLSATPLAYRGLQRRLRDALAARDAEQLENVAAAVAQASQQPAGQAITAVLEGQAASDDPATQLLNRLALPAVRPLLAAEPASVPGELWRMQRLSEAVLSARSAVLGWLAPQCRDPALPPGDNAKANQTLEEPIVPRRVRDGAFLAMESLIRLDNPVDEHKAWRDQYRQMPNAERDRQMTETRHSATWQRAVKAHAEPTAVHEPAADLPPEPGPLDRRLARAASDDDGIDRLAHVLRTEARLLPAELVGRWAQAPPAELEVLTIGVEALEAMAIEPILRTPLPEGSVARLWLIDHVTAELSELLGRAAALVDARLEAAEPAEAGAESGAPLRVKDHACLSMLTLIPTGPAVPALAELRAMPAKERDRWIEELRAGIAWQRLTQKGC